MTSPGCGCEVCTARGDKHHVETFRDQDGEYGWECFTCHEVADGFQTHAEAGAAGDVHCLEYA